MSDYSAIGQGVSDLFKAGAILLCIFVPLGMWKLVEIVIWLFRHITVSLT